MKALDADKIKRISAWLARIEGQIRAIRKMVERQEDCQKVMLQLLAARASINSLMKTIITCYINNCLQDSKLSSEEKAHLNDMIRKLL